MDLSTKNKVQSNVVIVECGGKTGTAFFISGDTLLTAFHNISGSLVDQSIEVGVYVDNQYYPCTTDPLGKPGERIDAAILRIASPSGLNKSGLKLLSQTLNSEMPLHTCGYPKELAEATYPFFLPLKHIETFQDSEADLVLVKKSEVSFFSYEGYSGSPVVNNNGSVIGIIALQENQNLRALSIKKIHPLLIDKGIDVEDNGEIEDDSPTGLGFCRKMLDECRRQSPQKYKEDLHLEHKELEYHIRRFLDIESLQKRIDIWDKIQSWVGIHSSDFNNVNVNYDPNKELPEIRFLEDIYYLDYKEREKLNKNQKELISDARPLLDEYRSNERERIYYSKKIFGIFGPAGVGKSHMTFHFSYRLINERYYVYYINGANINALEDIVTQVRRFLGMTDEQLQQVNSLARGKKKNVIIVIDAINEGAAYGYWKSELSRLLEFIKRKEYDAFKLLVSGRGTNTGLFSILEDDLVDDSYTYELHGFENVDKAIEKYCGYFRIDPSWIPLDTTDFSNPLFLLIFCLAYRDYQPNNGEPLTRKRIYSTYLTDRNELISALTDEDPNMNITLSAVRKLAEYSVLYKHCDNVPRSEARKICNRISYRREWSKSLLKHLISENILFEINDSSSYEKQKLDFEFQNFGDVFRAEAILKLPHNRGGIIRDLISNIKNANDNIVNCLIEVFGAWDVEENPMPYIEELPNWIFNGILIRGNKDINDKISNLIKANFEKLHLRDFFEQSIYLRDDILWNYHSYMTGMTMSNRDLKYIKEVNQSYDIWGKSLLNSEIGKAPDKVFALRQLIYWGWSCITSYPDYKFILVRNMCRTLVAYPNLCLKIADAFHSVDDDYVREAVYCAIYGALLITRDNKVVEEVAISILKNLYAKGHQYPHNLLVRQWTTLIIEYASQLSGNNNLKIPNFKDRLINDNPLAWDLSGITYKLLGDTPGGKRLQYNVSSEGPLPSDFNRYIIGTNSSNINRHFITKDNKAIGLNSIEKMLVKEMLNLGWNDHLGNIDTYAPPYERYDNAKEKIGKKYLWIAYQNVMALLSDNCNFVLDGIYAGDSVNPDKIVHYALPWMIDGASRFDPTLNIRDVPKNEIPFLKFKSEIADLLELFNSNEFAKPILNVVDRNEETWFQIDGWDNWTEKTDDNRGPTAHIEYIGWIIKGAKISDIIHFLESKGDKFEPDMPIDCAYEFLWNEFPWSERTFRYKYEWKEFVGEQSRIMPLRVCQLQEDMGGIEYEQRPISNAMLPNWDFMQHLGLYTAERGIVRDIETGSIVSYNRDNVEIGCSGLIVRKSFLDQYLEKIDGQLIIRVEYYKSYLMDSVREFEWFIYDKDSKFKSIIRFKQEYK